MNRHERRKAQKTKTRVRNFTYKQLHTDFDIHVDTGTSSRTGREIVEICASPAGRETVSELFPECEWVMGTPNYIPDDWRFTQIHVTRVPAHYTAKLLDDDGDYAIEAVAFAVASSLAHHAERGVVHFHGYGKIDIYNFERKQPSLHRDFVVEYSKPQVLEAVPC